MNLFNNNLFAPASSKRKPVAEDSIEAGGKNFKVFIYIENRSNCTVSIGKKGVHIRLSKYLNKENRQQQFFSLKKWAFDYILEHKLYEQKVQIRKYNDGDIFKIQGKEYIIKITYDERNASKGNLKNGIIHLTLSTGMKPREEQKHKSYLVSRLIGNEYQPMIAQRMQYLNDTHFQKKIKKVTLRYNQTNWGSCSHDGKISVSTGLLFAPPEIIDYILIHELAHLVEHNHSDRFWSLVESKMPGYNIAEKWLSENGKNCVF
ncbi:MAG: M48 family metallopeptidase [Fimbriimonadaceae bacterium]|nr:M48 family metallopeptidase [Chitinophagales bacterium]